eukprot:365246-Chlamydomonas_euryale.AAC.10
MFCRGVPCVPAGIATTVVRKYRGLGQLLRGVNPSSSQHAAQPLVLPAHRDHPCLHPCSVMQPNTRPLDSKSSTRHNAGRTHTRRARAAPLDDFG